AVRAVARITMMPKSFSTDRLPNLRPQTPQSVDIPVAAPLPRAPPAKKKDELWNVFRTLDGDYAKFASKSVALKTNVVRTNLLPFLRTYANHASNFTLRAEDLDRRAMILNRWWTGLIEMLHGRNNQSISGTDRPAILDGISGIMDRPEWRLPPSPLSPHCWRTATASSSSAASTSSGASDSVTESVQQHVRAIFIQKLCAQMAFIVDKMSQRHASASLVSFCGKACAYAFLFVPGMAEVLVRLWDLPPEPLRRVLAQNGVGRFDDVGAVAADVAAGFPPALQGLEFASLASYLRKLRTPPLLPPGTANVQWWGRWRERWTGRESDLFYVFVRHFHLLVSDYLAPDANAVERVCAPGVLLVHAQILANLDATIHRASGRPMHDQTSSSAVEGVLANPDAVVAPLPLPQTNAIRLMAENRLIMLIRDFLSEGTSERLEARIWFASAFAGLLEAAAKGTTVYDQSACQTLLDFLEEALLILVRFELRPDMPRVIDSAFWLVVFRRMIESHNTMTEIRLYSFLYTVWPTYVSSADRKRDMCLGFLLDEEVFDSRFNHWCPMVRAYFMRLLCWRLGRPELNCGPDEVMILNVLQERLNEQWGHYLWLRHQAELNHLLPPTTAPCNPAPSRRLLIVRTDCQPTMGRTLLSLDSLARPPPTVQQEQPRRDFEVDDDDDEEDDGGGGIGAGIGSFIRKMVHSPKKSALPTTPNHGEKRTRPPRQSYFKFSLECPPGKGMMGGLRLSPPKLPPQALAVQRSNGDAELGATEPQGRVRVNARYCGRALAEWGVVLGECAIFLERRRHEGVPSICLVETPALGVEVFRK
ncbi:DUF1765-domain-containing protein, partial [Piedraia hortae CBS 480.64]